MYQVTFVCDGVASPPLSVSVLSEGIVYGCFYNNRPLPFD